MPEFTDAVLEGKTRKREREQVSYPHQGETPTATHQDPRIQALLAHAQATRALQLKDGGAEWLGNDPDADELLRRDGVAMLIGLILQRGMKAERVWRIPLHLYRELGHLDPSRLAAMSVTDVEEALRRSPERPRFPAQSAATVIALGQLVRDDFDGDGRRVWQGRRMADVIATLESLPGVGPNIAHMAVGVLMSLVGYSPQADELPGLDVKADVHVVRVFHRLGIATEATTRAAILAARRFYPAHPGRLDWPAWHIGSLICRPHNPACAECPIESWCEKNGLGDSHGLDSPSAPQGAGGRITPQRAGGAALPQTLALPLQESGASEVQTTHTAPQQDELFWAIVARLVNAAMPSANHSSPVRQFAGAATLLEANPTEAVTTFREIVSDILRTRLAVVGVEVPNAGLLQVIDHATAHRIVSVDDQAILQALFRSPHRPSVATAIAVFFGALCVLGR
jgi:uncharacterized HhH-GPD family protein